MSVEDVELRITDVSAWTAAGWVGASDSVSEAHVLMRVPMQVPIRPQDRGAWTEMTEEVGH